MMTRNPNAHGLGFYEWAKDASHSRSQDVSWIRKVDHDKDLIRKWLKQLELDVPLVLLHEKYDESLVLLRRFLNWPLAEMQYMPVHGSNSSTVTCPSDRSKLTVSKLNEEARSFLAQMMMLDIMLYDWATLRFNQHILTADKCAVNAEVATLRRLNHQLTNTCQDQCSFKSKVATKGKCDECNPCMRNKYKQQGDLATYASHKQQEYHTKPSAMLWSEGGSHCSRTSNCNPLIVC